MKITNYIKDSFSESTPFKWGLTLFSYGCNLRCLSCLGYNYEQVTNKDNILGDAINIIGDNITPMHDSVIFIGGEPTIHGDKLIEALKYCKKNNLKTKIFTNGQMPLMVKEICELNLCDAWSVDVKCLQSSAKDLCGATDKYSDNIYSTIFEIMHNQNFLEIRTTIIDENKFQEKHIKNWVKSILEGNSHLCDILNIKHIMQDDFRKYT